MPTQEYHPRPFYVQWCPSDTGGGNHAVRDRRTGEYVKNFPDVRDCMAWTEYAAQAYACELNMTHVEQHARQELESLHDRYNKAIREAVTLVGSVPS